MTDTHRLHVQVLAERVGGVVIQHRAEHRGGDCIVVAHVLRDVLRRAGIKARLVAGGAGWRITHEPGGYAIFLQHAWIEAGDLVVDATTGALRILRPAALWSPLALVALRAEVLPMIDGLRVATALGVAAYQPDAALLVDMPRPPADLVARLAERASRLDG